MDTRALKKKKINSLYEPRKLNFKYDKDILEMFIGYIFSTDKRVTKLNLNNLKQLMTITDPTTFDIDIELGVRFNIINNALTGKLIEGIDKPELLKEYCRKFGDTETDLVLNQIPQFTKLSPREIKFLTEGITHRLQFGFIEYYKDIILDDFMRIDQTEFNSFKEIALTIKDHMNECLSKMRSAENIDKNDTFSLDDDVFTQFVKDTVEHIEDPSAAIKTGIQFLNDMLSPGFMPGKLYNILSISGIYKSSFLLYCAYWARKYNKIIPRRNPLATPCVVLYLLENDIEETIIRLFNISTSTDDISKYKPDDVVKMMKSTGGLAFKDKPNEVNIIIKYRGNNSLSPSGIDADIQTLADDNKEVVMIIIDYLKRMKSDFYAPDERIRLRDISNGVKDVLVRWRIAGVSAQQLNRSAGITVDSAEESGKTDLAKLIGRGNIADAWDIYENSDWVGLVHVEIEHSSGVRYLTVKELKKRYRSNSDITYFNHPFVNGSRIMLQDDFGLPEPLSKISLASNPMGLPEITSKKKVVSNNIEAAFGLNNTDELIKP